MSAVPFLLQGVTIGLALAAPVGPMSVLCIRRTLSDGLATGLISGLGIASADATYGAIAAFGISAVAAVLVDQETALRLIGGLFLLGLGLRILLKAPVLQVEARAAGTMRFAGAFLSCFLLTMTNPATIVTFVAIFAGVGLIGRSGDGTAAIALVAGVFAGSALWWLALCGSISVFRRRLGQTSMVWINRVSGAVIAAFGIGILVSLIGTYGT